MNDQRKSPSRQTRGDLQGDSADTLPRFRISNLREVDYGRLRWAFDLIVGPVTIECNVMADDDGNPRFVTPAAVKDSYTHAYRSTAKIEPALKAEVFEAVVARLCADEEQAEQPETGGDRWAEDQEARLDRAMAELDGAA